jgi:murein DD-endopeptidase MepM/ murein hydrolase activator NlpD
LRKRYIVYVTRGEDGSVDRVSIPMRFVYVFVAAAITGMFTIAGMAGSYSRMLVKAESVNSLRDQLALTRKDYAHLESKDREKDVQAASLGSLASEVSAIYGLTAGKFAHRGDMPKSAATAAAKAPLKDTSTGLTDASYHESLTTFENLRDTALHGLDSESLDRKLGVAQALSNFAGLDMDTGSASMPNMWPVMGPINSGFGQRIDPVLGMGIGEFHKGIDIGASDGTPVHAPANGRVIKAGLSNGYGNEIEIDHGNGITTVYGHLQGFNVVAGQNVVKGQVIGYVGHTGKVTGPHLHYEVQEHGTAINPRPYLRTTLAQLGGSAGSGS